MHLDHQTAKHTPCLIETNVSLHDKNWFQTGGNARYFAQPSNPDECKAVFSFADQEKQPIFILGHGANILFSDEGFAGLVIKPRLQEITVEREDQETALVRAGAGVSMEELINFCLDHHLVGLEEFSGIPGTVGGSVYINLHYFEYLLSQFLVHARVLDRTTNTILNVDNAWFNFGYNHSTLMQGSYFLIDATFKVKKADALTIAHAHGRKQEIIRHRLARYPKSHTCGSFFRNFTQDEVTLEIAGKKMIYVAYYLDKIGVKGHLRIGNAQVSYQHANMIVNLGNATSADIINVARTMQEMVYEQFGIVPQPECRLIGFSEYPLLTKLS